ncbi:hypothetical protein J2Z83_002592 [Virgibacillus natechei]|uniref:Secreted protein n=1 Tax=Virgibacillus natechei TaxID=1216297 RepID=A0ABS4IHR2_9BACI|nr:hypothetical protein [Virgibacillus natechei]MBP1970471.1 hypothetical protein [Virgibacillus natechei]UZD13880.1 hypothetical protein OLD84_04910 [Virgibacillus natechei]
MDDQSIAIFGAWTIAIGTTISAVADTPSKSIDPDFLTHLNTWGNVLQASGSALIADTQVHPSLDKFGNQMEATGNLTNVAAFLIDVSEEAQLALNSKGDLLQAVGGSISLADTLNETPTEENFYNIYGSLLEIIGNSMQSIASIKELRGIGGQLVNTIGSWIQAIGATITAIGATKYS